ncbi:pseudaminic acid synthase [Intrasporangium calvum]|uniref:N-acetylneuraminate synthase n=1 Tax=Intrasporangium calvum (strain ATCC 23552 / DSM 43043 / JCM 3097 / NBRC 12989 / NCIMB 10167 / NRRL B-3866 / 7 KIP) TaxID=710696 RepID=E6S8I3_INTC7|nr:pseudaminic acid synthase [Intrasporangium calvum]ADU49145.1 N-acetylneuraminate synthase [Intrasporangium calvum DSM 43043]
MSVEIQPIEIGGHLVGSHETPLVIAEVSGNHNGSLDRALEIIEAIASSGAQAVKFQTYTADTLTLDASGPQFRIRSGHELWGGRTLHDLYEEAHTPWEWHATMFERARSLGLIPFSSPFDPTAIELLESLDCPVYKIASAEMVDLPLIREVASTGKPMIISTGMATLGEIDAALTTARDGGCRDMVLLACTASYPADPGDARLLSVPTLREAFGIHVGLSDHTPGIGVSVAAVALGAVAVEKHVTLQRAEGGVDSDFSLEPNELASLVRETAAARLAVGPPRFGPTEAERDTLALRRSLYVVEDVRAGDKVTQFNVRSIRPSGGLATKFIEVVLGRTFVTDVQRGTPLTWELI